MAQQEVKIKIKANTPMGASNLAKLLETIGNNIDKGALEILAAKSKRAGMSAKIKKYKNLI